MGKSYKKEIQKLDSTYKWASEIAIEDINAVLNASRHISMMSVGSGGSLTSAILASLLHEQAGRMSTYLTPLEMVSLNHPLNDCFVFLITAGGRNPDIVTAFKSAAEGEPDELMVLCGARRSLLKHVADDYQFAHFFELDLPSGRDGFLATNSLMAFSVVLTRAYKQCLSLSYKIPESLRSLVHPGISKQEFVNRLEKEMFPLLKKDTLIVLYGKWGKPAAFDFESKCTEAALVNVQLADYRNFAHGRHYWLAKKGTRTGVLALMTADDRKMANKTLDLIPQHIPTAMLSVEDSGPIAALNLIAKILYLIQIVGQSRHVDPGCPSIPEFGVSIYNLSVLSHTRNVRLSAQLSSEGNAAIFRKIRTCSYILSDERAIGFWTDAFRRFVKRLEEARYSSIVLDYDGTLCDPMKRLVGISTDMGARITSLLKQGINIGIATGRGKSVRRDLQNVIPKSYWSRVHVGYYNGSDIGSLDDDTRPDKNSDMDPKLQSIVLLLKRYTSLTEMANIECRPKQVSLVPVGSSSIDELMNILRTLVEKSGLLGVQVFESSHSIDVLAPDVSKINLVKAVDAQATREGRLPRTLCIGDKGKWPGNDFILLSSPYSLSVDTVSEDPDTCWNLAPLGQRGVQATLDYFNMIKIKKRLARVDFSKTVCVGS